MSKRIILALVVPALAALALATAAAADTGTPAHHPLYTPNTQNIGNPTLQPPPVCCAPTGPPVAGEPAPVNMAYFGGHVQVQPKIYLVFWVRGPGRGVRPHDSRYAEDVINGQNLGGWYAPGSATRRGLRLRRPSPAV